MSRFDADYRARCEQGSDIMQWLPTLYGTVATYARPTVVELGVRSGNSTAALLAAADLTDGHVHSCDVNVPAVPEWWQDSGRWTVHIGDDVNPAILADMPDAIDVLFIDSSHHYDHTLTELRAYVPRMRQGGTVLMHDTELEMPEGSQGEPYPVARALNAYCAEAELIWVNNTGCYGLGVITI